MYSLKAPFYFVVNVYFEVTASEGRVVAMSLVPLPLSQGKHFTWTHETSDMTHQRGRSASFQALTLPRFALAE